MVSWNILIVDDEAEVALILGEYLLREGHSVEVVMSGAEAIERLRSTPSPYDIALVDWHMPGISGRDVIGNIQSSSPETTILVTTGHSLREIRMSRGQQPWAAVLNKPFSLLHLREQIRQAMSPPS